jgi:protein O-GlcNAc transferase
VSENSIPSAESAANPTTREGARHALAYLGNARARARAGDWVAASQAYREVLRHDPDQVEALEGLGLAALEQRKPSEALEWLSRALERQPNDARILSNLGVAQGRSGLHAAAIASYEQAHRERPTDTRVLVNLARAQREAGDLARAIDSFERALSGSPEVPLVWSMLSNALREAGRVDAALDAAEQALARDPWLAEAHLNRGAALHLAGRVEEAVVSYFVAAQREEVRGGALRNLELALVDCRAQHSRAGSTVFVEHLLRAPGDVRAGFGLARSEYQAGRNATAIACYERALKLAPSAQGYRELAHWVRDAGHSAAAIERLAQAIVLGGASAEAYRLIGEWLAKQDPRQHRGQLWKSILETCPDDVNALVNLGAAAQRRGWPVEAARLHRRAIGLEPRCLEAHLNLGAALTDQGLAREAIAAYQEALEAAPRCWPLVSNLLFALHLDPEQSRERLFAEHQDFGRRLCETVRGGASPFLNSTEPGRRLRIGYVSPDFRNHPVAHFIEPVLREHDPSVVEVFCYSDAEYPDPVTRRLAGLVREFVPVAGWRHAALIERIRADKIDILVDLAGHTGRNRLPVFAERPSPVQVSWLGYFDTTGLPTIDYRIADSHSVRAEDEPFFVEKIVRLPRSANCYLPPPAPEPSTPPCLETGSVTFGCFNNPMKVGRDVVAVFARVLNAVPGSRLLLKYSAFTDPYRRERYQEWFREAGIDEQRILFEGPAPLHEFMASFARIDIALDPFPYSGETTALHTLWMGVPLVVLEGPSLVQRLASRVLSICDLRQWVAAAPDDYVRTAVTLAQDPEELTRIRASLRSRLQASPLLDHRGLTRELEVAYRGMWKSWCSNLERPPV